MAVCNMRPGFAFRKNGQPIQMSSIEQPIICERNLCEVRKNEQIPFYATKQLQHAIQVHTLLELVLLLMGLLWTRCRYKHIL